MNKPRKPDWRVSTPSQIDDKRWIDVGAAWDVMPPIGKLSLFPWKRKGA